MKVFITGAAGFVGSHLVPVLIANRFEVTAMVRNKRETKRVIEGAKIVVGDLSQKGSWKNKLSGNDLIIHLAAEISSKDPKAFEKNNVQATKNLIAAAKSAKIGKIILFSSAAVSSIRQDPYSLTKNRQEKIVKSSKIDYIILRPSMIYGPGDIKNIGWLIKITKRYPIIPLPGGGRFGRQPVFVDDICKIVLKLTKWKSFRKKILEIHGYEYVPLEKMIKTITKKAHLKRFLIPVPVFFFKLAFLLGEKLVPNPKFTSDQIDSLVSGERFKGDDWARNFGIIATTFEEGVGLMIEG